MSYILPYDPQDSQSTQILHTPLSKLPVYDYMEEIPDYYRVRICLFINEFISTRQDYKYGPSFIKSNITVSELKHVFNDEAMVGTYSIEIKENGLWKSYKKPLISLCKSNYEGYFNIHPKDGYINPAESWGRLYKNETRAYFAGVAISCGIDPALYGKVYRIQIVNGPDQIQQILGLREKETLLRGEKKLIATVYDYTDRRYYDVPWDDILFRLGG